MFKGGKSNRAPPSFFGSPPLRVCPRDIWSPSRSRALFKLKPLYQQNLGSHVHDAACHFSQSGHARISCKSRLTSHRGCHSTIDDGDTHDEQQTYRYRIILFA